MGNAASDFQYIGKKLGEGWEATKAFGKKAWDTVKSVPVLGSIAGAVEKYSPIGLAATTALKGIDAAATGGSKLLRGDIKGALGTATSFGRDIINQKSPLIEGLKKVPGIGGVVSGAETAVSNVPIYGGMSINTMRSIGNAGLNAVDAFKEGDVKGGFKNLAKGGASYLGSKGGKAGMFGKAVEKVL